MFKANHLIWNVRAVVYLDNTNLSIIARFTRNLQMPLPYIPKDQIWTTRVFLYSHLNFPSRLNFAAALVKLHVAKQRKTSDLVKLD